MEVQSEPWLPACHLTLDLTCGPTASLSRQLPHAPEHPVATLSTSERRAINLTWAKPFDGNSPLLRYVLEMSENSKSGTRPAGSQCQPPVLSLGAHPSLWSLGFLSSHVTESARGGRCNS